MSLQLLVRMAHPHPNSKVLTVDAGCTLGNLKEQASIALQVDLTKYVAHRSHEGIVMSCAADEVYEHEVCDTNTFLSPTFISVFLSYVYICLCICLCIRPHRYVPTYVRFGEDALPLASAKEDATLKAIGVSDQVRSVVIHVWICTCAVPYYQACTCDGICMRRHPWYP